jgi:hypothetical protein
MKPKDLAALRIRERIMDFATTFPARSPDDHRRSHTSIVSLLFGPPRFTDTSGEDDHEH